MLVRLDNHAIDEFYPWLVANFPADEVKPLPWIKRMLARGDYTLFAWQEDNPLALAFFYHGQSEEAAALLDYLLVHPEAQSQGIGSKFLNALIETDSLKNGFLVELERLDLAESQEDYVKRQKRLTFYQRLDFQATKLLPEVFGVGYRLYHSPVLELAEESIKARYLAIYQAMVPEEALFKKHMKL